MTFLEYYYDHFYLPLLNRIDAFCDNKSYDTKLKELKSNEYSKLFTHKIKEHEAYLALLNIIPNHFNISHVKEHQDDLKIPDELEILEQLNIAADIIATSKAKRPLDISFPSTPFANYANQKYIHIKFQKRIRESCFEHEVQQFLQSKYNWDKPTIQNIDWTIHSSYYKSLSINKNKKYLSLYISSPPLRNNDVRIKKIIALTVDYSLIQLQTMITSLLVLVHEIRKQNE